MRYLIVGRGLLAQEIAFVLRRQRLAEVLMVSRQTGVDITDMRSLNDGVRAAIGMGERPWATFNCAAYTAVDGAERDPAAARAVNAVGAENVARLGVGSHFVHFSTDAVFGSEQMRKEPNELCEPEGPATAYGVSKLMGERLVRGVVGAHVHMVRTANLYGDAGRNWGSRLRGVLESGQTTTGEVSRTVSPTWARWVAETAIRLLEEPRGTYHLCAGATAETGTWADFGETMARRLGRATSLIRRESLTRLAPQSQVGRLSSVFLPLRGIDVPTSSDLLSRYLAEEKTCTES